MSDDGVTCNAQWDSCRIRDAKARVEGAMQADEEITRLRDELAWVRSQLKMARGCIDPKTLLRECIMDGIEAAIRGNPRMQPTWDSAAPGTGVTDKPVASEPKK